MKQNGLVVVFGIACSAAICSPHRPALVVSDAELTGISSDDRSLIDANIALLRAAEDDLKARKAALAVGERDVELAALSVSRDKTAAKIAELRFQAAQESQDADTMLPANKAREDASAQLERSVAAHAYSKAIRSYLEEMVTVGEAEVPVAGARVELSKYEAATRSGAGPDGERLAAFKSQLAAAEAYLAEAGVSAAKAKTAMDGARPRELPTLDPVPASPHEAPPTVSSDASPVP